MKRAINYLILSLAIVSISCDGTTDPPGERQPAIYGKAVDTQGNPVANADVCIIMKIPLIGGDDWSEFNGGNNNNEIAGIIEDTSRFSLYPNHVSDQFVIEFTTFEPINIRVQIIEYATNKITSEFEDALNQPGTHKIYLPIKPNTPSDSLYSDGLYWLKLSIGDSSFYQKFMVITRWETGDYRMMRGTFHTNSKGEFKIDYDMIPIGREMDMTDASGRIIRKYMIGDSIAIVAKKQVSEDKYLFFKQKMEIRTARIVDLPCVLEEE